MSEELLQTVGVPFGRHKYYALGATTLAQLKRERIIARPVPTSVKNKKPDGLITLGKGVVKACIEYKLPKELRTEKQIAEAIAQELEPARYLCHLLIVTDGKKTFWVNPHTGNRIKSDQRLPVFDAKPIVSKTISSEEIQRLEQIVDQANFSLSPDCDTLRPLTLVDPSQLARTVWQKIWINTGKEPEKCLYNVVELLVFKFLSDLAVLEPHNNFSHVYDLSKAGNHRAALTHYARISRRAVRDLFPEGDDDTTIINGTIFVNQEGEPNLSQARLFYEVLDHLQDFDEKFGSFKYIQREFKTRLYESFLRQGAGLRHLGQYFTPRNVVRAVVKMSTASALQPGASLCDPFCGVGGFLLEAILESPALMSQFQPRNGKVAPRITVAGYDKGSDEKDDERTIILAKANTIIYFSDLIAKHHSPDFMSEFAKKVINPMFQLLRTNLGTFAVDDADKHDLILTNPPYVTSGSSSLKTALAEDGLEGHYPVGGRGTESLAVQWVLRSLKPGGRAFIIVPDGLVNQASILQHIKQESMVHAVISLPARTFYSTPKKTYIIALERKMEKEEQQTTPIFSYLVSEIGESRDANRWDIDQNDLEEMVSLFNQFKGAPLAFQSSSARCKIIRWEEFDHYEHWMVNRYWTQEELTDLAVIEEPDELNISDFNQLLTQLGQEPVKGLDSNAQFAEVSLGNTDFFTLLVGKRVLRKDCVTGGGIPCFSANVQEVFGYIEESDILTDFDEPSLTWGIDGIFDWSFIPANEPFHPTDHCGVLRVLEKSIDPVYLHYALRATRDQYGFDRTYRANLKNMRQVSVPIPISADGSFDLKTQQAIADKYRDIEERQTSLLEKLKQIATSHVILS